MMKDRTSAISLRVTAGLLLVGFIIIVGRAAQHTIACFLLAFVFAYLLDPLVVMAEQRGVRRINAIIVLYVILGILSIIAVTVILPTLSLSATALINQTPVYLAKGKELLNRAKETISPRFSPEHTEWLIDNINAMIEKLPEKIGTLGYSAISRTLFNIFNLVLSPILVFFMLLYKGQILQGIRRWLPDDRREAILQAGRETNVCVSGYIRGQLIVSLIVAILSTGALLLLGIDYPILSGLFAGCASILPFIGVIIATLPPLFFAYVKFQSGIMLLKVVAAFSLIYFLEGYLVKPLVFKESMNLNPLTTILMVMACGEMFGFWGILLAIPLAAAIKVFANHARRGSFSRQETE